MAPGNQRITSTACLKQLKVRVPQQVPRRRRSACSRRDSYSTVSARTDSVAVYVTLIMAQGSCEVDLG